MPLGLNRSGDFRKGNPVPPTDPTFNSNPVDWTPSPAHFGNAVTTPKNFGNVVNWTPSPTHFGNTITDGV
jgi:hypothetical protein